MVGGFKRSRSRINSDLTTQLEKQGSFNGLPKINKSATRKSFIFDDVDEAHESLEDYESIAEKAQNEMKQRKRAIKEEKSIIIIIHGIFPITRQDSDIL